MTVPFSREHMLPRKMVRAWSSGAPQNAVTDFLNKFFTQRIPSGEPLQGTHGLFLDSKGRVISDAIIVTGRDSKSTSAYIDCPIDGCERVANHLRTYSEYYDHKIDFEPQEASIFCEQSFSAENLSNAKTSHSTICPGRFDDSIIIQDPRPPLRTLRRIYLQDNRASVIEAGNELLTSKDYNILRYSLGIAEGLSEFSSGKSLPTQYNYDLLRGIDFEKGCYLGQELTRKTHFVGSTRRRIVPIRIDDAPDVAPCSYQKYSTSSAPENIEIYERETMREVGHLVALEGSHGLVMYRCVSEFKAFPKSVSAFCSLRGNYVKFKILRPDWWPRGLI